MNTTIVEIDRSPQTKESGIQCTHCKVYRLKENFIGKSGQVVKQCLTCRENDEKHKKEPAIASKINAKQREVRRDIKYREREREKDEKEYLERNAKNAKNYRDNNKEHISEWRKNNFASRFRAIKQQAQIKKIIWNDDLTDEICYQLMTSKCFYCNFKKHNNIYFVIDLENVWKWLGFSRKDPANVVLEKHFVKDVDFIVALLELYIIFCMMSVLIF